MPLRIRRGPFEQDPSFLDDVEPLGKGLRLVEVVCREQDRGSFPREFPQDVPNGPTGEGVQADRRLVEEHERGLRRHDRGDHGALFLPAAQRDAQAVRDLEKPHLLQGRFGPRPGDLSGDAAGPQVAVHLFSRREVKERLPLLRHDRDQGPHPFRLLDDVETEDVNPTRRREEEGGGDSQERRLAGAVPSEERHPLPPTNGKGDPSQGLDVRSDAAAVYLPHVLRLEGLVRHAPVQANDAYKDRFGCG